jgi:hypothetical protein
MNASTTMKYKLGNREENWQKFFSSDSDGKELFKCISSKMKAKDWATAAGAAKQIASIFRTSSLAHHATPLSIIENREIEVTGLSNVTQQYQFIICVANVFNLSLV